MPEMVIEFPYRPHKYQAEMHRKRKRFNVWVCHRRYGKTVAAVNELINGAFRCTLPRGRFMYIAPERNQAKDLSWLYFKDYLGGFLDLCKVNESELWIEMPHNQARIFVRGADYPHRLRGPYYDGVVMDEVAQMKPEVWTEVIRGTLADRKGWVVFIGTPRGLNLFSELYFSALKNDTWSTGFYSLDETGTDLISAEEQASLRRTMPENLFRQEFMCDFTAETSNAVIGFDLVREAVNRELHSGVYADYPIVMGVDVAWEGDDDCAVIKRQGPYAFDLVRFHGQRPMELTGYVAQEMSRDNRIVAAFVDGVGIGGPVADRLRELGFNAIMVQSGATADDKVRFKNRRAENWFRLADWMKTGKIPDDERLRQDLLSVVYTHTSSGKILLKSKKEMKDKHGFPSPDSGDALMFTFDQPVAHRHPALARFSGNARADYDVLAHM